MVDAEHAAHIIIHGPGHEGTTRILQEGITTFGRLPSNDIILLGDLVSRHHARITYFEGRATLQDLGSHNGCFVNADRITTKVLRPGDKCRVGNFQVLFRLGYPPAAGLESTTTASEPLPTQAPASPRPSESVLVDEIQAARRGRDPSTRALRFVLQAADALATAQDLAGYMDRMLELAIEQTEAQLGVYMTATGPSDIQILVARTQDGHVDRPHVSMAAVRWVVSKAFAVRTDDVGQDIRFLADPSAVAGPLSVVCVPLGSEAQTTGALYLSRATPPFSEAELDTLGAVAHLSTSGLARWSSSSGGGPAQALGRLFPEAAVHALQRRISDAEGGLMPVDAAVLTAGLFGAGGSASRSQKVHAHAHFYDAWVETVVSTLASSQGEVTFGPGAQMTAVFGPAETGSGRRALESAMQLRDATDALVLRHPELAGCRLRAGLDQGRILVGAVGGPHRVIWSALGEPMELSRRLESAAPAGAILITEAVRPGVEDHFQLRARGEQKLRGRIEPLVIHEVLGRR